ncbi:MAG: hypothetical protein Q8P84_07690, partial [Deltaproteobacteria bacterium]|nr:hypothetical protein [Deltaproteobacteria bacterium]
PSPTSPTAGCRSIESLKRDRIFWQDRLEGMMAKAKKKTEESARLDRLGRSIGKIIEGRDEWARQIVELYAPEVKNILLTRNRDEHRICKALDTMLDYCFDPTMLALFKKLCRHYYFIDPVGAASYVYAYRDMWDSREGKSNSK